MPRFAANLSLLYPELDFLARFEAAAKDGFKAVEFLFPYAFASHEIAARLTGNGLQQVLFNAPPGDWDAGERGLACLPGREAQFRAGIDVATQAHWHMVDVDRRAVGAAYLQAAFTDTSAVMVHGNSLSLESWSSTATPIPDGEDSAASSAVRSVPSGCSSEPPAVTLS